MASATNGTASAAAPERGTSGTAASDSVARLQLLADASRTFAEAGHDPRAVIDAVAVMCSRTIADSCQVRLLSKDGKRLELLSLQSRDQDATAALLAVEGESQRTSGGERVGMQVVQSGQAVLMPVITLEQLRAGNPPERWHLYDRFQPRSALVVPLRVRGRVMGALGMVRYQPGAASFTDEDVGLAQELADRAALTLESATLFEQAQRELAERRRVEAEREVLIRAIEQAAEVVMVTDAAGAIQYVNPAFESVTGYSRDEAIGNTPRMLKSGMHDESFYRTLWDTLGAGRAWRGRLVNRRKDGARYIEDASISPVRDERGAITSFVGVKRDISREIALEAQLAQAQRMEGIGRLAGGVAHDFNNALTVILTCATLALDRLRSDDPARTDLLEIEKAGTHAASLTRQLLAFSRKQVLQPEPLELNRVLQDVEAMLRRIIGEDIALITTLAKDLWVVTADRGQIEQVIMNLAVNARDAMPEGGRLSIETSNAPSDGARADGQLPRGDCVRISVSDTGIGMDEATTARIFEPFFTTKGPGKGTGLGLSTVYGIVKQSGGAVSVTSTPGKGTTFELHLPRATARVGSARRPPPPSQTRGTETVLLVEDDAAVRMVIRRMLESAGYRVMPAANGQEGMRIAEEHVGDIDLLLTDVVMPGMGGRSFAERFAAVRPQARVLFMSGYTDDAVIHHGVIDSGTNLISKPLTQADLLRKLRAVLDAPTS